MEQRERFNPFTGGTEPRGGLLKAAPLALVLCQVQWPDVTPMKQGFEGVAERVGERLTDFPLRTVSKQVSMQLGPGGALQSVESPVYQWNDVDQDRAVTLTPNYVTLSSLKYVGGYEKFSQVLQDVLITVLDVVAVPVYDRLGLRYVNRIIEGTEVADVGSLIKSAGLGLAAAENAPKGARLAESQTVGLYELDPGKLVARMGMLPPQQVPDPAVPPVDAESWVVDIDSFEEGRRPFTVENVLSTTGRLADAARDFLRYVTEPAFEENFGAEEGA